MATEPSVLDAPKQAKQSKRPYYGGGMPKGHRTRLTMDKEAARARLRELVMASLDPLVEAQLANAMGVKYLVARDKKTGKFRRLGEAGVPGLGEADSETEVIEVWEKDPNVTAFTDLLNRTIDKPTEQVQADIRGDLVMRWKLDEGPELLAETTTSSGLLQTTDAEIIRRS